MSTIFYNILMCSLCGSVAGAVILIFRRFSDTLTSPRWKCAIWTLIIVLLVLPYRIPLDLGSVNTVQITDTAIIKSIRGLPYKNVSNITLQSQDAKNITNGNGGGKVAQAPISQQSTSVSNDSSLSSKKSSFHMLNFILNSLFPISWLFGVVLMLVFMALGTMRLKNRIKYAKIDHVHNKIHEITADCCRRIGLKKPIEVVVQSYLKSPVIMGVIRAKIILPEYTEELDEETLRYIIMHELSHYKRFDMLTNNLLNIVRAIHWFNPFVWVCIDKMHQDLEIATDAYVLKHLKENDYNQYAMSLLRIIGREQCISLAPMQLCMVDNSKHIKRRIMMIKQTGSFKKRAMINSFAGIVIIAFSVLIFFTVRPSVADASSAIITTPTIEPTVKETSLKPSIPIILISDLKDKTVENLTEIICSDRGEMTFNYYPEKTGELWSGQADQVHPISNGTFVYDYGNNIDIVD